MSHRAETIAVVNQKGGTGKTTTTENLGIGLCREGKKVLLIDTDPQASLTISLGFDRPDELAYTLTDVMKKLINDEPVNERDGILLHPEGVELMPSNITLAGMEVALVNVLSRENILKQYIASVACQYDYILLDCMPSLGLLTVNALAAVDEVLIPVQAQYLSAKGLEQLLDTVSRIKRNINPKLKISGILLTMVDVRTKDAKEISELIHETYGSKIKVYQKEIPKSVRAAESSQEGRSIFLHDPNGKVAQAYQMLTKEVIADGEKTRKAKLTQLR